MLSRCRCLSLSDVFCCHIGPFKQIDISKSTSHTSKKLTFVPLFLNLKIGLMMASSHTTIIEKDIGIADDNFLKIRISEWALSLCGLSQVSECDM